MIITKEVIKGFVKTVLSSKFDDATETPEFHEEVWELCCSKNPLVAVSAPRG